MLRTLALEGGAARPAGILNDRTADGRDVSWVWDADWELLAGSVRRMTCAGTRAAELALRMKYAGADPARLQVVADPEAALDAAVAGGTGPLYVLPTYTALLELRDLLARRGDVRGALAMTVAPAVAWHDVECGGYRADLPLWLELAAAAGGPVLDVGAGTGRVALELARAGHDVTALDSSRSCSPRSPSAPAACPCAPSWPTRSNFIARPPLRARHRADADDPAPARARAASSPRRARISPRRAARDSHQRRAGDVRRRQGPLPEPDVGARRRLALRLPADGRAGAARRARRSSAARLAVGPDGSASDEIDLIELAHVSVAGLEAEGVAAGLRAEPHRSLAPTDAARRLRGGAAAWLTARCASARSIPT